MAANPAIGGERQPWCILRTKGSSTLRLARSLDIAGLTAWTPTEFQIRKSHKLGTRIETAIAVMPTYVFAKAHHLPELLAETESIASHHPRFGVFCYNGRFPLIADDHLIGLRAVERKAAAQNKPVVFPQNTMVRIPEGAFQGLTGRVVQNTKGKFTLVAFPGFGIPIEFPSWQLDCAA
jgi:transcription antitermination factor NusG